MAIRHTLTRPAATTLAVGLFALSLQGCASVPSSRSARTRADATCPELLRASSKVTTDDINTLQPTDLYDALRWYRPSYLQGRSSRRGDVVVYVDGLEVGGIENLHDVRASEMVSVTLVSAPDATTRFGARYPGGLLLVQTNRTTAAGRCLMD